MKIRKVSPSYKICHICMHTVIKLSKKYFYSSMIQSLQLHECIHRSALVLVQRQPELHETFVFYDYERTSALFERRVRNWHHYTNQRFLFEQCTCAISVTMSIY